MNAETVRCPKTSAPTLKVTDLVLGFSEYLDWIRLEEARCYIGSQAAPEHDPNDQLPY